jgi:hypothetical protein
LIYVGFLSLYCSKHGLWSDSFHKEYFMVLPYLKGSLYIIVFILVWLYFGISKVKGLF